MIAVNVIKRSWKRKQKFNSVVFFFVFFFSFWENNTINYMEISSMCHDYQCKVPFLVTEIHLRNVHVHRNEIVNKNFVNDFPVSYILFTLFEESIEILMRKHQSFRDGIHSLTTKEGFNNELKYQNRNDAHTHPNTHFIQ